MCSLPERARRGYAVVMALKRMDGIALKQQPCNDSQTLDLPVILVMVDASVRRKSEHYRQALSTISKTAFDRLSDCGDVMPASGNAAVDRLKFSKMPILFDEGGTGTWR